MQPPDTPGIRCRCPTRWTVKADALLDNYAVLWDESLNIVKDTEMKTRILDLAAQIKTFKYFYGLVLAHFILCHCDNLSCTLLKNDISVAEGQDVAELTLKTLLSTRTDDNFTVFWEKVKNLTEDLDVDEPHRKCPRQYFQSNYFRT